MKFNLKTVLLFVTIICLAIALWLERARTPDVLYLHLFSNRYDIHSMRGAGSPSRDWQCIATVSVVSGAPFFADIPCHYEPTMSMQGTIDRHGELVNSKFSIDVADVGPAYHHEQYVPVKLNNLLDFGDGEFRFSISDISDGQALLAN